MPDTLDPAPTLTVVIDADTRPLQQQLADAARLSTRFSNTLGNAFVDATLRGKNLGDVLRSLTLNLSALALKAAFKPLTDQVGTGLAGLIGGGVAFAKGGIVPRLSQSPMPVPFAEGGVISSPVAFPLGDRLGLAGERGAEAILPLARGPDGALGVRAQSGGGVAITFNVTTPDAASFQRSETQLAALLARAVSHGQRNL
jgi:phage-related minor tail protein